MSSYVLFCLPLVVVAVLMASGRVSSNRAGLAGLAATIVVALTAAPATLDITGVFVSALKGLWLSWLVGAVILGGLLFSELASDPRSEPAEAKAVPASLERRRVFSACFLVGPFAEAATGFGVGQVTTVAMLLRTSLSPQSIVIFGLFSQSLVSWGAMANGTMVGAEFGNTSPHLLGTHSSILVAPIVLTWLMLFSRFAAAAGLGASLGERMAEFGWIAASLVMLLAANHVVGPEVAGLMALGPLIVLQFWLDEKPDRARWRSMLRISLPYAVLIAGLAASRAIPAVNELLREAAMVRPFHDVPAWHPLLHPGSWLAVIGLVFAVAYGQARKIPSALAKTWAKGKGAVATIAIYLTIARIMTDSGTAAALAAGLSNAFGLWAILATPWLAGTFGFLTGSSNASNALLMSSQVELAAKNGLPVVWIAALQNTAAAALTMLSPARVAMGCALVGLPNSEGRVYRQAWVLGLAPILIMTLVAALLAWTR